MLIFIDLETSGLDPTKHGMLSLGAVTEDGQEFYMECRLSPDELYSEEALKINGFSKEEIYSANKPTANEVYKNFVYWLKDIMPVTLAGQNIGSFDIPFLKKAAFLDEWPFGHRYIDIGSVAYSIFGKNQSLDKNLLEVGLDEEVKPHKALNGAKKVKELYHELRRIIHLGKNNIAR